MLLATVLISDAAARPAGEVPGMTRYVLVCALLLCVLGLCAWGLRTFVAGSVKSRASRRSLHVVDVLPLGGKQRLCVVRCYDRTFALGIGEKEVSLVAELDAETARAPVAAPPARASFADLLAAVRGRVGQSASAEVEA